MDKSVENFEEDRFCFSSMGTSIKYNNKFISLEEYRKILESNNDNCNVDEEQYNIGDIVVLKHKHQIVKIDEIDFKVNGLKVADYAGHLSGERNRLILFSKKHVLEKYNGRKKIR